MKVLLLNGSIHEHGTTAAALAEVAGALEEAGVQTELVQIGAAPISDCLACGKCMKLGRCVLEDGVNAFVERARTADGFVFGSPVYYAHPSGRLLSFLDRAFYCGGSAFRFKPAAAVLCARRAGTVASFDVLNKYFAISSMPIVSSTYWNQSYGSNGEETRQDAEGMMTMQNIGRNMAWLLRCMECARQAGITPPENPKIKMNFIR